MVSKTSANGEPPSKADEGAEPVAAPKAPAKGEALRAAPAGSAPRSYWAGGGKRGRQPKLRLLGSLRGEGVFVWSGGSAPVAYELDVFGGGATRSASGFLEGDLSAAGEDASVIEAARLRLAGGREVAIEITSVDPELAEFEASLSVADADFLTATA